MEHCTGILDNTAGMGAAALSVVDRYMVAWKGSGVACEYVIITW